MGRNVLANVVGRERELAMLAAIVENDAPLIHFVHGVSGIGKTTLLRALDAKAIAGDYETVFIDGREIEPTPSGFIGALTQILAIPESSLEAVVENLQSLPHRCILLVDSAESLGLIDAWLRQSFIPALPDNVRIVMGSRILPGPQWTQPVEWRGLVDVLHLGPLDDASAHDLLSQLKVPPREAERIVAMAGGIPVALMLAGNAAATGAVPDRCIPKEQVLQELSRRFLGSIDDPEISQAVRAASVVRRLTATLLQTLLPRCNPESVFSRLRSLSFCHIESDGLRLHDAVREAVAADLRATDPDRFRRYQQAAWRQLDMERREAGCQDMWRYTADLIYLINNPICRDAFFPPGAAALSVVPASPEHRYAIQNLARHHETPVAAGLIDLWLAEAPDAFHVVIDAAGEIVGFYCLCNADKVPPIIIDHDPVIRAWSADLTERPMAAGETALFLRRWLSADSGEAPSAAQAASWLDIKRTYLELRPSLRRVYLGLEDLAPYAQAARTLGFEPLGSEPAPIGNRTFRSAVLDMGSASVDGWLSRLVAAELGIRSDEILDRSRRGVRLEDRFVPLTPREFELMAYLDDRKGTVVTREDLLNDVWGVRFDGCSNVVDAVMTSLRRKLGEHASVIETVRGHGYMYRPHPANA